MLNQLRRDTHEPLLGRRVNSLLTAAAAPTEPGPLTGESEVLAAFRATRDLARRPARRSSLTPLKATAAIFVSTGLLLTGTVAATATGSLPGPAQHTVHEWLTKFGVIAHAADERPDTPAPSPPNAGAGGRHAHRATDNGAAASDHARNGYANGVAKGEAVSELARGSHGNGAVKGARQSPSSRQTPGAEHGTRVPRSVSLKSRTVDEGSGRSDRRAQEWRRLAPSSAAP